MTEADLAQKFSDHLSAKLNEASDLTGNQFMNLRNLIKKKGAVNAARILLSPSSTGTFTYGFRLLSQMNLLRLTVEQAVLDFALMGLFSDETVSNARARLTMAKMLRIGEASQS